MEDRALIALYQARDERAITATDKKYHGYCFEVSQRILKSREDSEECVNDTWLRAWNSIPPSIPDILRAYLGRICRNLSLDRWRADRSKKRGEGEIPLILHELEECVGKGSPQQELETKQLAETINLFLEKLDREPRYIFLRRYWYTEPLEDIARHLNCSVPRVKSSLYRTRQRLKGILEQEGYL